MYFVYCMWKEWCIMVYTAKSNVNTDISLFLLQKRKWLKSRYVPVLVLLLPRWVTSLIVVIQWGVSKRYTLSVCMFYCRSKCSGHYCTAFTTRCNSSGELNASLIKLTIRPDTGWGWGVHTFMVIEVVKQKTESSNYKPAVSRDMCMQ